MNYNLLKSRTFWTIIVTFLINGFAAISGKLDPTTVVVVNILTTALATYFHIDGVQNAYTAGNISK